MSRPCPACGDSLHPQAYCCRRCKDLIDRVDRRGTPNRMARLDALRRAWDGTAFRCAYSSRALVTDDHRSPWYLTFDHRTPRHEDDVVCAGAIINDMKTDMTEEEFKAMVFHLAARFSGRDDSEPPVQFAHWRR